MAGMMGSKLIVLAQMGSTIAIGLLVDTFIVRSLLMPSIAVLLGRWFWWPTVVYPRGDNHFRQPSPRPAGDERDTVAVPAQTRPPAGCCLRRAVPPASWWGCLR